MTPLDDLGTTLKTCDLLVRNYVTELEKENKRLQHQIARLRVKNVSQKNEIAALKRAKPETVVQVVTLDESRRPHIVEERTVDT